MDYKTVRSDQLISQFPLELRKNIKELLSEGTIGLSSRPLRIVTSNKVYKQGGPSYEDRFVLEIPYAGTYLQWEVLFNAENLNFAPDFEFINDYFLSDPDIDVINNNIPSLVNWDVDNPRALLSVVKEFLSLYKHYQMNKLNTERKFINYSKEYKTLLEKTAYKEDDIEVHIDSSDGVHFLIVLRADCKALPTYVQPLMHTNQEDRYLNPGEDIALLKISYIGSKVLSSLMLSPRMEQHLGHSGSLHIPCFNKENGLIDYIANIDKLLHERMKDIERFYKLRNEFISCLLSEQGQSVVEYDNVQFNYAALLLEVNEFYCLVSINVGPRFPVEKPQITMRSVYNELQGKPRRDILDNYPYSPRWSSNEMVTRLLLFLREEIPKFKSFCKGKNT